MQKRVLESEPVPYLVDCGEPEVLARQVGAPRCDVADNHSVGDEVGEKRYPRDGEAGKAFDLVELGAKIVAKVDVGFGVVDAVGVE